MSRQGSRPLLAEVQGHVVDLSRLEEVGTLGQSVDRKPALRIRLSEDRRQRLIRSLKQHFLDEFDDEISDYRADALLDFFIGELGPSVYNQGVHDACAAMQEKLLDLEGEVYEPDRSGSA